jgi:hypothetical protein
MIKSLLPFLLFIATLSAQCKALASPTELLPDYHARKAEILSKIDQALQPHVKKIGCAIYIKNKIGRLLKRDSSTCPSQLNADLDQLGQNAISSLLDFFSNELESKRSLLERQTEESVLLSGSLMAIIGWPNTWTAFGLKFNNNSLGLIISAGLILKRTAGGLEATQILFDFERADRAILPTLIMSANVRAMYLVESPDLSKRNTQNYNSTYMPGGPTMTESPEHIGLGFTVGASVPPVISSGAFFKMKGHRFKLSLKETDCNSLIAKTN